MGRKQSTAKTLRRGLIEEIYNSTPMPEPTPQENPYQPSFNSGMSRDEIANIYNSYNPTQEIPKLEEQNTTPTAPTPSISDELKRMEQAKADTTTPRTQGEQQAIDTYYNSLLEANKQSAPKQSTPTTDYKAEIERVNAIKADTSAVRTEGENKAIDDYLASLEEAQRYVDSQKPQTPGKKHIGTVEIKADGTKEYTKAMSDNEKRDFERRMRMDQAKVIGRQARENAQPRERALSANEQRDYDRAMEAIAKQPTKEEKNVLMPTTADENKTDELTVGTIRKEEDKSLAAKLKPFTEPFKNLPKKEQPRYDDRGFLINPSITENQDKVDSYLDPNKKLSEKDLSDAKKLIREYENSELGEKNENAYTLVFDAEHPDGFSVPYYTVDENGNYDPSKELTPEEREYRQSMGYLKTKISNSESALVGAMQTVPFVDALQRAGDVNGDYARMVANSQKQNPLAYWGGLLGTGVAMNAAGQFALKGTKYGDLVNKILGADKEGASIGKKILADAAMDVPVDLATDIIPTLSSDIAQGKSFGEVLGNTAFNVGLNGLLNVVPATISNFSDLKASKRVADNLFGGDYISKLEGDDFFTTLRNNPNTVRQLNRLGFSDMGVSNEELVNHIANNNDLKALFTSKTGVELTDSPEKNKAIILDFLNNGKDDAKGIEWMSPEQVQEYYDNISRQIAQLEDEKIDQDLLIELGDSPRYLEQYGNVDNPLVMTQNTAKKIALPDSTPGGKHDLGYEEIKRIQESFNNPAATIKSKTQPNSALIVTGKLDNNNKPIMYPVHMDKQKGGRIVNEVASGQGRSNLGNMMDKTEVLFENQERVDDMLRQNGLQLPKREAKSDSFFNKRVIPSDDSVNILKKSGEFPADDMNAEELLETVKRNSAIDVKSVQATNKQLDNNLNSLANMFGKTKNNEGVIALKEALNEYTETGSEEALTRARQIAHDMDGYYQGASYVSKRGNTTDFGNGSLGTFTSQVENYADTLKGKTNILGNKVNTPDLDERINNLFTKYDISSDDAESVGNLKQAINNYIADPSDANWKNLMNSAGDVSDRAKSMSEYVSSYKGKTKNNPFDRHELDEIMDDVVRRGEETKQAVSNSVNVQPTQVPPTTPTTPIVPPEGSGELVERGMSRHVRNDGTPMRVDVPDEVKADFDENPEMYKRLTNAETKARADAIYERGGDVETTFRRMLSQKDPASLALGHRIAQDLSANGQYERAAQIYRDMGRELTQAGQFSQASVLAMMKNDPLTALYYAQKEIDNLNVNGAKRFGDKWKDFELTPEEVKAFGKIDAGDEKAIAKLYDQIGARLGKEYPTTLMDKLLEGRRVAMLFNLRTNIRNFGANVPTLGMRWVSDRIDSLGQHYVHLLNPDFEVTNSLKGAGIKGRKLANEVYDSDTVQALLRNTNGKYSPDITSSLMQNKQMFKGTPLEKWINKATNGGIEKINKKLFGKEGVESGLETIRNATYAALELGDSPFVKENFVERLGSYINAKGIKDIKDIPDDAIQVAWEEAMKATYKDNSWAVKMLRGLKNSMESVPGIGRPLSQSVIPFLQAPGNIAARMVDYSPIKATKGIADMISGANANDLNKVRKGIEEFSKGATGSGMIVLGMKLKQSGLITGDYSEDKDQRNFEKQHGFKPYALHVGDKYYTYDWAQPFAEPMIIGTLLQEAIDNSDQYDSDILKYFGKEGTTAGKLIGGTKEGVEATVNSWFNASPLQGIANLMKGDYSGEANIAKNIKDATISDFASSFIPSLVNATTKSVDPTIRNTYDPSNTFGTFLNEQAAKIPGLSDNLPAKYDTWGNEMKYADSKGESFARKFIVPGDYGKDSDDPIDQEINSLFESTSDNRVFPMTAPNKVDGVTLNNKEVSAYQEDMGKRSREIVESLMDSDYYNDLEDNEKAETLNTIYSVSKAITERDLFDKQVADNSTYKGAIAAYDEGGAEGLTNYLEGRKVTKESGVKTTSKAGQAIQDLFDSGDREGAQRLSEQISRLSDEGLNTEQQGVYASRGSMYYDADTYANLYDEINTDDKPNITQSEALDYLNKKFKKGTAQEQREALQIYESMVTKYTPGESKFAKYDPEKKKYVAVDPKDAKNGYSTSLIPKVEPVEKPKPKNQDKEWDSATLSEDPYTAIAQSGVGHGNQYMDAAWDKAILANSNLTPQEFIDTWGAIDTNGSGKHDKDEFRTYLNDNNIGEQEGKMILDMYYPSNWGKITYKNGTWK